MFGKKKPVPKKGVPAKKPLQNGKKSVAPQSVRGSAGRVAPKSSGNRGGAPVQNNAKTASRKRLFKKRRKALTGRKPAPAANIQQRNSAPNTNMPQKPLKPVPEQARRAADKATLAKNSAAQPRPYRGGNYTLYFILAALVVGVVMAVLSNTVLFKCSSIEVTGTTLYSADEIIASTGIVTGDNLLHVNAGKAAENVMNTFAFVDKAEVKKNYPTKIVIEITEAVNWFALSEGGKTNIISRGGKVLGELPADGLVVVKGFEAQSLDVGTHLASKVEAKNKIVAEICAAAEKVNLQQMTEIDMTDRFSIKITVEDRIILNIGAISQLEGKLRVAQAVIEKKIADDERVSVLLTNPERVAVESLNPQQKPVPSIPNPSVPEPVDSEPYTDDTSDDITDDTSDDITDDTSDDITDDTSDDITDDTSDDITDDNSGENDVSEGEE